MNKKQISSLMYHGIHENNDSQGKFDPVYSVTPTCFAEHLDWIKENHYRAVTLEQAQNEQLDKAIIITFDDGDVSNYLVAFPELVKRGMTAEFYITSDWINTPGYMSEQQLREMHQAGMSIQAHGQTHRYMSDLTTQELEAELAISKDKIEAITQQNVHTVALPGGRGLKQVLPLFKKLGYKFIATSILGPSKDHAIINRVTVTVHTNVSILSALVKQQGKIYHKAIFKQTLLNFAKKLLGNRRYDRLRNKLL